MTHEARHLRPGSGLWIASVCVAAYFGLSLVLRAFPGLGGNGLSFAYALSLPMEEAWRSVGTMSDAEIKRRQGLCGKEQHELTAFMLAYTEGLGTAALGVALYAHFVVMEAFRRSDARFSKLKPSRIESTWKASFAFTNELRAADVQTPKFS